MGVVVVRGPSTKLNIKKHNKANQDQDLDQDQIKTNKANQDHDQDQDQNKNKYQVQDKGPLPFDPQSNKQGPG